MHDMAPLPLPWLYSHTAQHQRFWPFSFTIISLYRVHTESQNHRITESQNHRTVGAGRDLCGSSSPTLPPKWGHLQQAAQDLVQAGLEYLQRRRLLNLPGQPVPVLHHPQSEEVLPHAQNQCILELQLSPYIGLKRNNIWLAPTKELFHLWEVMCRVFLLSFLSVGH